MQHILPAGKVFQAGTLSGNPVATAAGIATLKELRDNPPYERLEQLVGAAWSTAWLPPPKKPAFRTPSPASAAC